MREIAIARVLGKNLCDFPSKRSTSQNFVSHPASGLANLDIPSSSINLAIMANASEQHEAVLRPGDDSKATRMRQPRFT